MVKFDQQSIKERLQAKTRGYFGDHELVFFGTNDHLFDVVAEELAGAMQYDEFLTLESKWLKSRLRSSLMAQVDFYPYIPYRKVGAIGTVQISPSKNFDGSHVENIPIPKYTEISNGERSVVTQKDAVIPARMNKVSVPVVQGKLVTFEKEITTTEYPAGTDYAQVVIDNPSLDNNLYDVYVNGVLYTQIEHLRLAPSTDSTTYTLRNKPDFSGIILQFGNNYFGKKLKIGDVVTLKAVETEGNQGNILRLHSLTNLVGSFYDAVNASIQLYVTNPEPVTGGSGYESKDSIKANAPRSYQTGDRAITRTDYSTIIKMNQYADLTNVWGEEEVNEDKKNEPGTFIPKEENMVHIAGFNFDEATLRGTSLTTTQQDLIRNAVNEVKSPTDIVNFVDTQFIYVKFHVNAWISDRKFTTQLVRANIHSTLKEQYSLINGAYRKHLYHSNYQRQLDAVEGVDHHKTVISFQSFHKLKGAYVFDLNLDIDSIKKNSVKIYVKKSTDTDWQLMAKDDGDLGNLEGAPVDPSDPVQGNFLLPGAVFDYKNGSAGEVTVSYGLEAAWGLYQLRVDFEVDDTLDGDLKLTKRQQIYGYLESDIEVFFEDKESEG